MTLNCIHAFGLEPELLSKIIDVFKKYNNVEKVVLYGSRAKGTYRPGSDIDLNLEGEKLDDLTLLQIENDLDGLMLPYKMDISAKKSITHQKLLDHISRVGKIIFQRTS